MKRLRERSAGVVVAIVLVAGLVAPAGANYAEGLAQYMEGDYSGAAATLSALLVEEPDHPDARYLLGLCQHKLGKYEEAREALAAVVAAKPGHGKARTNLARALLKLEAYDAALAEASKGAELHGDWGAYNVLGLAFMGKEQFEKADAAFATAIQLNPEGAWAYNNRGYALILKGGDDPKAVAAEALKWFNKALERSPGHEVFLRNKEFAERVLAE